MLFKLCAHSVSKFIKKLMYKLMGIQMELQSRFGLTNIYVCHRNNNTISVQRGTRRLEAVILVK